MKIEKDNLFMALQPGEDAATGSCGCLLQIEDGDPHFYMCEAHAAGPELSKAKAEEEKDENAERAARALVALEAYGKAAIGSEEESNFRDLLADLMHYADAVGLEWDKEVRLAIDHYYAERRKVGS